MKNWLLLILVFFYLINPNKDGYIFGYLILFFLVLHPKKTILKLDSLGYILLIFSIAYAIFYSFSADILVQNIFIYGMFPLTFYLLGIYLFNEKKELFSNTRGLILIALVFSVTALFSTYNSILENGYNILNRNVNNIWTGLEENATYTGGFLLLNMCLPGILIVSWKKIKILRKLILISLYIITLFAVLRLGSRTQLVISIFSILAAILYLVARQSTRKNFTFFVILIIIGNITFGYLNVDKDSEFISAYTDRMESKKYGTNTAGGRTERWEKSIEMLFDKPLGWNLDEFGYSHNLWLDVLRVAGIIPFILLIIFSVQSIKMLVKNLRFNKNIDPFMATLAIYILAFYLLFFVEPIFEGYFEVFVLHCFYLGLLTSFSINNHPLPLKSRNSDNIK
ncbi:O-antigen ligase family protein [Maribacter hydrothermalis]|uniref:O-antigen ligase n=1 Tax=Maribacter hydrothermalis TaxID=1836467 RepID=A0A1B7ZD61_9FLAO|nr:O-antigen ligase family protein [Maribacter hydrothermalis]APQ18509.1 hypothetical protein BTR34_14810 [Maribacter hydrothermalis]OBR41284.1 hypothetical protein A9200_13285 [Maribacter hydrothermalis]